MDDETRAAIARIESKLDALIFALAEEDDEDFSLDGMPLGRERQEGTPL